MGQIKKRNRLDFARLCREMLSGRLAVLGAVSLYFLPPSAKERKMKGLEEKTCYSWRLE